MTKNKMTDFCECCNKMWQCWIGGIVQDFEKDFL